jgi:hypothetical protein
MHWSTFARCRSARLIRVSIFAVLCSVGLAAVAAAGAVSPNGTTIPSTAQIIDNGGNVWTLTNTNALENGEGTGASGFGLLLYYNNSVYGYASSGNWSQWYVYTSGGWIHAAGDPRGSSTASAVNGACGSADDVAVSSAPSANLCNVGSASAVSGSGPWSWSCLGSNGGATATCSAPSSSMASAVNGACGSADNVAASSAPSANLCNVGSASAVSGSGPWSWSCLGSNGGATATCSAPTAAAASNHLGQSIPSSLFGMQTHGVTDWPMVPFGVLGKGSGVVWPYIETSRGTFDWSTLDGYIAKAKAAGVPLIYTFEGVPGWAIAGASTATCGTLYNGALICAQPPDNMADWTNYVTTLVTRYCPNGVPEIQYYELWNEPYDVYGTNLVQLSPSQLATMTHAAYKIIRSDCPSAKIISPDFSMVPGSAYTTPTYTSIAGYAQYYFQALGPVGTDPVDIAAVHIYTYNQNVNTPEDLLPGGTLYSSNIMDAFNTYAAGKPIWNTEGSWQQNGVGLFDTVDLQAAFIARWYILHWAAGYSQANWYAWDDSSDGTLCNASTDPCIPINPLVTAYQQTYDWLVGRTMYQGCSVAGDGVTYMCPLTGPNGYTGLLVWDTAGNESYTPLAPAAYTDYRDLAGNVTAYSGGAVTVGPSPILFEN